MNIPTSHQSPATQTLAVIGGGLAGCLLALEAAERGARVVIFEAGAGLIRAASRVNEGRIHLGYVYGADPTGQTAGRMIEAARTFRPGMERWMPAARFDAAVTGLTDYVLPHDTCMSPAEVEAHFTRVDDLIAERFGPADSYLGVARPQRWQVIQDPPYAMAPEACIAAYRSCELSVDTFLLADEIAAAVHQHPRIETRLQNPVRACTPDGRGWSVETDTGRDGPFDTVANAAWGGRLELDRNSGFRTPVDWITRFKASVYLEIGDLAREINCFAAINGLYGDAIAFPAGRIYLNWYPSGMIAHSTDLSMPRPTLDGATKHRIYRETIDNLARLYPALADLPGADPEAPGVVDGGFIIARGKSDISDRQSELHQRHAIGLHAHAPGYLSLDTGKYTAAPQIALACADAIVPQRRVHAAS